MKDNLTTREIMYAEDLFLYTEGTSKEGSHNELREGKIKKQPTDFAGSAFANVLGGW